MERRTNPMRTTQESLRWDCLIVFLLGLLLPCTGPVVALGLAARQMRIEVHGRVPEADHTEILGATQGPLKPEIVDPCLGSHWRLIADAGHPERPGRLVLTVPGRIQSWGPNSALPSLSRQTSAPTPSPVSLPIIRAGDSIVVLQQTPILRARFRAVALESALAGQTLRVRLMGGANTLTGSQGTVVDVRAAQPGEVVWLAVEHNP